jgi:phage baseplate assembly protein W
MALDVTDIIYSDVNVDLGTRSPYELVYNEDAIKNSILTIIGTRRGSRPFRRTFGSSVLDLIFDPLDEITAMRIQSRLQDEILRYETRVAIERIEVLPDYNQDAFYVSIAGWMPELENRRFDFNFNLNRSSS